MNDERGRSVGILEAALKSMGKNVDEIYAQSDPNLELSASKLPMIKKSKLLAQWGISYSGFHQFIDNAYFK